MNGIANGNRDTIIEENIRLVHSCAHRFKGRGLEYDDLFQAGCMGLVKAVDAFDTERGVKFSTYAVPVILGEIRRLFRDGGSVKVSRTLKELSIKVVRVKENYCAKTGREPTVSEIAEILGTGEDEVVEAIGASVPPMSLTESEEDGSGQIDLPVDSPEDTLSEIISLEQVVKGLPESDQSLIRMRYFEGKTQSQTALKLGMTQVQVSRREKKILMLLRRQLTGS